MQALARKEPIPISAESSCLKSTLEPLQPLSANCAPDSYHPVALSEVSVQPNRVAADTCHILLNYWYLLDRGVATAEACSGWYQTEQAQEFRGARGIRHRHIVRLGLALGSISHGITSLTAAKRRNTMPTRCICLRGYRVKRKP